MESWRRSEGQIDERSRVLRTPLDERRAQVDQLREQQRRDDLKMNSFSDAGIRGGGGAQVHLSAGAGLVAGSDQVGGVGQIDEQFLLGLQSRSR